MTRTDVHSPANLVTEDYRHIITEVNYIEGLPGWVIRNGDWGLELARWVARTDHLDRSTDQCHHCGTRINYFAILEHIPTGDAIVVGETCLDNRFERATADFQRLRKQAALDRQAQRIKKARAEFIEMIPQELAWLNDDELPEQVQHISFIRDVQAKFHKYGELSEKQVLAVQKVWEQATQPKPEEPNWIDVPVSGRVEIEGEVMTLRVQPGYGYYDPGTLKALLKVEHGDGAYKVWVTVPKALDSDELDRGSKIKIRATIGKVDGSFCIAQRPVAI